MKVAIYCRVSREGQTNENQKLILEEYAKRMGYEYTTFEEQESSRKTRPIQWDLYNRLLRKEFDGLLIYKFDRWARSTRELVEHMENLNAKGIMIYSFSENVDLSSSMGRAMLTIISAFAQLERDIIKERTMAGLERAKAQGKKLGRPKGKPSPKDAPIEVCKRYYSEGHNIKEIAKILETTAYRVKKALKETIEQKQGGFISTDNANVITDDFLN